MRRVLKRIGRSPRQAIRPEKRWRTLERLAQALKKRTQDVPPEKLQAAIDEAVREIRAERKRSNT